MSSAALALVAREWGIVRRSAYAGLLLSSLGVAFLAFMCGEIDRYRLLADPMLLRSVLLPGALLLGLWMSFCAFARELRSGTWDGLMLLPCPRWMPVVSKVGVAAATLGVVLAAPVLLLREVLAVAQATGGPILERTEVLTHTSLAPAALLGLVAYLAGGCAALLARERRVAFLAPLVAPLFVFLSLFNNPSARGDRFHPLPLLLASALVLLAGLLVGVLRFGRPLSGLALALRACSAMPLTVPLLLAALFTANHLAMRSARHEPYVPQARPETLGIDTRGAIVKTRNERSLVSMHRLDRLSARIAQIEPFTERRRLWIPAFSGRKYQIFLHREQNLFLVYGNDSGPWLGCLGRDGLRPSGCQPFDERPVLLQASGRVVPIVTAAGIFEFDTETGAVAELHRGHILSFGMLSLPEGPMGFAIQAGPDLLLWSEADDGGREDDVGEADEGAQAEARAQQPGARLRWCRGAAADGLIEGVAVHESFIAAEAEHEASRTRSLVVCRDGAVAERRDTPQEPAPTQPESPPEPRSAWAQAALGPVLLQPVGSFLAENRRAFWEPELRPRPLGFSLLGAAAGVLVLAGAMRLLRLREVVGRFALYGVAFGLLLGPGYALACLLVLWRARGMESIGG